MDVKEWLGQDNKLGQDIWYKKYCYQNETFEQWIERVSGGDRDLGDLIRSRKFLFGGRALANRNTDRPGSMFNCYSSGYVGDSVQEIMELNTNLALTYKAQGGQGVSLSKIRPKGTRIGEDYESDGIVPFMEMFNTTTASISQGGARKGALMMSLDIRHKEAPTFITIKSNADKITNANLSLELDDEFMEAVKKFYETGEKVVLHEKRYYGKHEVKYDIIPIELYKLMIQTVYDWGEPGCIFTGLFRNYNLMEFDPDYEIATCNPCLHPDTLIQTTEGLIKIKDMKKPMMVYCMDENNKLVISQASPSFITRKNASLIKLTFNNGNSIKLTPNHLVYIQDEGWIEAGNLTVGQSPIALLRGRRGACYSGVRLSNNPKSSQVMEHRLVYEAHNGPIEDGYDIHHINGNGYDSNINNLQLLSHSEHATITRYECENNHQIRDVKTGRFISSEDSKHGEKNIIQVPEYLTTGFVSKPRIIKIEEVENSDVYDITVEKYHNFIASGIIVHNCGEQPLPRNFSCNLGSLNLSEFINSEYTDSAYFDHASFRKAVRIAVKALDTIIDENLDRHALKEQSENSKNYRNMGLGIFGYANALFKLGITYGSKKAKKFTDSIFKEMFITALETSNQLAKEKGMFPKCKPEQIIKSRIIQNLNDENLVESIKKFGLRNCSLISIAPTGSIATMLGCSGGCEPEFALSYTRHTVNLQDEYKVYCKSVQEYCKVNNTTAEFLPEYFVSSADIDWKDRVEVQGIMQKWVDTAISSTINLAEDTSISEVEQIYLYAWEQGLKGITIFRSGCKRIAILNAGDKKEEPTTANIGNKDDLPWGKVIGVNSDLIGIKTKLTNGCGSFHFQVFFDEKTGRPWETFISLGDGAGCERNLEAISRLMSKCLRAGVPVEQIIDSLKAVRPCAAYCRRHDKCGDTSKGSSCPNSIGFALESAISKIKTLQVSETSEISEISESKKDVKQAKLDGAKCPECGEPIIQEGGCNVCKACGYSKCN